ncbi:MAG: hypothetical protein ABIT01_04870 [Thermoanaerobaculia bacterium]
MNDSRPVTPFSSRPSRPHAKRVERARDRKVADFVQFLTAVKAGEAPDAAAVERLFVPKRVDSKIERPTHAELVYTTSPATNDVVFATRERAEYVDSLHAARHQSKTWGEFKSQIGEYDWQELVEALWEEPPLDGPFQSEAVPGFCDGDWPPWLQKEMLCVFPAQLADKYVTADKSSINGVFYRIKESDLPDILRELEERGISAVHEPDLNFW